MLVTLVTDCGGQALARMHRRTSCLLPDAKFDDVVVASIIEAGGNIIDQLQAGLLRGGPIMCNSAPRQGDSAFNGADFLFTWWGQTLVVSTEGPLQVVHAILRDVPPMRRVHLPSFMVKYVPEADREFLPDDPNFRGLDAMPYIVAALVKGEKLEHVSTPYEFQENELLTPRIWLIDDIEKGPYNLKTTMLLSQAKWFVSGKRVRITIGGVTQIMGCYERLKDVPQGELGLYVSSSGYRRDRFLEIAVMNGSAAEKFHATKTGVPVTIELLD